MENLFLHPWFTIGFAAEALRKTRCTVTDEEKQLVLQAYKDSTGDWLEILNFVSQNISSIRITNLRQRYNIKEYYQTTPRQTIIIKRMQRIVNKSIQKEARDRDPESTSMSAAIINAKMRYAKKAFPETRTRQKISEVNLETSSEDVNDEDDPVSSQTRATEPTRKKKRKRASSSVEPNRAHRKMCDKAMKMMDKIQSILKDYETSDTD